MKYESICEGRFISRPNRFIAYVEADGGEQVCHVKNTGRCRELLVPDARVILSRAAEGAKRKTAYDLVAVYKNDMLINMDSAAPNAAVYEWLKSGGPGEFQQLRPEYKYGDSRFDFYGERDGKRVFMEVKGVTLENNGIVSFPDAPTERGRKHIEGLIRCVNEGHEGYIIFVVQMEKAEYFTPNRKTDPAFAEALERAEKSGVRIICRSCNVTEDSMVIGGDIPVKINEKA